MKRNHEQSAGDRPKRPKTSQACAACRKHKTRCEVAADPSSGRCHRCNVLSLPCSFITDVTASKQRSPPSTRPSQSPPARTSAASISSLPAHDPDGPSSPANFIAGSLVTEDLVFVPSSSKYFRQRAPGGADWTEAPMTAMYELLRRRKTPSATVPPMASPTDIVDDVQLRSLVDIFEAHYLPWMDLPPHHSTNPPGGLSLDDFYTLARCAIACRNLPQQAFAPLQPPLQHAVEHAVLLHTFDSAATASRSAVHALLALSLWSPAIGPVATDIMDAGPIAAAAVRMARALLIDRASQRAVAIKTRARAGAVTREEADEFEDLMYQSRLWIALCNVEWSLCVGTNRMPTSVRSKSDHIVADWRLLLGTVTLEDARDLRLGMMTMLVEATHTGRLKGFSTIAAFSAEINEVCISYDAVRNVTGPQCPMTCERLQMDTVAMLQNIHRLLVLLHGLMQLRRIAGGHVKEKWMHELDQSGSIFIKEWGMTFVTCTQIAVINFLDIADRFYPTAWAPPASVDRARQMNPETYPRMRSPLAAAPDHIFANVMLSASLLLVARYSMVHQFGVDDPIMLFTPTGLLARLADRLDALALSEEHAPRKCASMMRDLHRIWQDKIIGKVVAGSSQPVAQHYNHTDRQRRPAAPISLSDFLPRACGPEEPDDGYGDHARPAKHSMPVRAERGSAAAPIHLRGDFFGDHSESLQPLDGFSSVGPLYTGESYPAFSQAPLQYDPGLPMYQDIHVNDGGQHRNLPPHGLGNEFWPLFLENLNPPGSEGSSE